AQGFYVDFADNETKDHVRGWNVHVLRIHRTKRHTDKATIFQLWDTLDAFCHAKKPQLIC
ncbi:accessory factor associated with RNA polymerase II, partial [Basidiobolus ranarum]